MKTILVMPVKNEEWILEKNLSCASLWADSVIIADQDSTDKTLEIIKKFPKVVVIRNEAKFHTSTVRKMLLDEARKIEGNNLILSFDADEIPTADIIEDLEKIKAQLRPGQALELQWLNLWRSPMQYRDDESVWSNSWKVFGFVDDRKMSYEQVGSINDHTSRVPLKAHESIVRLDFPKVLHYQFADWNRMMSKQCRYRLTEFLIDGSFISTIKINHRYYHTKNEKNVRYSPVLSEWIDRYESNGANLRNIYSRASLNWFDLEIISNFNKFGCKKFRWLDIWDIDWQGKATLSVEPNIELGGCANIFDPRNALIKFYHSVLQKVIDYDSFAYKILTIVKKKKVMFFLRKLFFYSKNKINIYRFKILQKLESKNKIFNCKEFIAAQSTGDRNDQFITIFNDGYKIKSKVGELNTVTETCILEDYQKFKELAIKQGDVIFDVGAHVGSFSVYAAMKGAKVFAFEPCKENYMALLDNIKINNLEGKITPFNYGVGGRNETKQLGISESNSGGHSLLAGSDQSELVNLKNISTIRAELNLTKVDLLKIDIEGGEYDLFESMKDSDYEFFDKIVGEYHTSWNHPELDYTSIEKMLKKYYTTTKRYFPYYFYAIK